MEITIYDNTQSEFYGTQFPNIHIQRGYGLSPLLQDGSPGWKFGLGINTDEDEIYVYAVRQDRRRAYLLNLGAYGGKLPLIVPVTSNPTITVNGEAADSSWEAEIKSILCRQFTSSNPKDIHAIIDLDAVEMPPMLRKSFLLPDVQSLNQDLRFATSLIGRNFGIVINPLSPFEAKTALMVTKTDETVNKIIDTLLYIRPSKLKLLDFIGSQQLLMGQFSVTRNGFSLDTKSDTSFKGYRSNKQGFVYAAPLLNTNTHDTDVLKLPMIKFKSHPPTEEALRFNNAGFFIFPEPTEDATIYGHPPFPRSSATRLSTMLALYFSPITDDELRVQAEKALYAASLAMAIHRDYTPASSNINNLTRTALRKVIKLSLLAGPDAQVNFRWYSTFFTSYETNINSKLEAIKSRIDLSIIVGGFSGLL